MLQLILRGLGAGFIVVVIVEIITRGYPRLGALILTLPITIPVVFLLMYLKNPDIAPICRLSRQTLLLIPLGLPFFVPMAIAPKMGWSFWQAFAGGLALLGTAVTLYLCVSAE